MKEFPHTESWTSMAPGEVLGREVEVAAGGFLHLVVEQRGIDVALELHDPGGAEPLRFDSATGRFGPEELLALLPTAGRYRWSVAALAGEPAAGEVRLLAAISRPATQEDRDLVAADQADRGGRTLLGIGAPRDAIESLQWALQVFTTRGLAWREAECLLALGEAQEADGALQAAAASSERAAEIHRREGRSHRLAHALELAGLVRLQLGEPEAAQAALEEARSHFEESGEGDRLAAVLARLGSAFQALGQNDQAVALLVDALERWRGQRGNVEREAAILIDLGWALLAAGDSATAGERFREATAIAAGSAFELFVATALRGAAEAASRSGQHEAAQAAIGEAFDALLPGASLRDRLAVLLTSGQVLRRKGDLAPARAPLGEALDLARKVGDRRSEAILRLELGYLATQLGEPGRGLEDCELALDLFTAIGDRQGQASAARRAEEARAALAAAGVAAAALEGRGSLPLEGTQQGTNEVQGQRLPMDPIEGAAGTTRPVNLTGTDLPGDDDPHWKPDDATDDVPATPPRTGPRRRRAANRKAGREGASFFPLSGEAADGPGEGDDELLLELDPSRFTDLLAASESTASPAALDELRLCRAYETKTAEQLSIKARRLELPSDIDPHDLSQTGWGIVISRDEDPAVIHHLGPLIERRKEQAGKRFKQLDYEPGESGRQFLWYHHGEPPGILDPSQHPYYLLLIGSPERIPFEVQYQLSINHAVGRLCFDEPADYGRYVERLLAVEAEGCVLPRRTAILSVENGDRATTLLAKHLVDPLAERLAGYAGWELSAWRKERARKEDLQQLLGGEEVPGLLLVSCHGKPLTLGSPWQRDYQGALECQRVPGAGNLFHARDLAPGADLSGLVAFLFACYGAGTPEEDNYSFLTRDGVVVSRPRPEKLADPPFVARLPQALLRQGALAVVGHVDRGWTLSFAWAAEGAQTPDAVRSLEDSLKQLLSGHRLGHALRALYRRYTALAARLVGLVEKRRYGRGVDRGFFAMQWIAHNDARNFVILGDPAVYLLGQRQGGARLHGDNGHALVELDPELLALVAQSAALRGVSVDAWLNELVRRGVE